MHRHGSCRPARRPPYDHGKPIWRPNLAPLGAVWAIAAALLMSVYGKPPHALLVDLPMPYPPGSLGPLTPNSNRLVIDREGALFWNGLAITDDELSQVLASKSMLNDEPALLFTPDGDAPYPRTLELLGIIERHGLLGPCFRFSGIARFRQYERPSTFNDLTLQEREDCAGYIPMPTMPVTVD